MSRTLMVTLFVVFALPLWAESEAARHAAELEQSGEPLQARQVLADAAAAPGSSREDLLAYAEFLDRYGDTDRLQAYEKVLNNTPASDADGRRSLMRRLVVIALADGHDEEVGRLLQMYRDAGGQGLRLAEQVVDPAPANEDANAWASIPGPLFSFRRMAALSSDQSPEELFPALARNIVTSGYRATAGLDSMVPTEYLKLIQQYLSQARELQQLAGADETIRIPTCESRETAQILKILGFRLRNECGPEAVLETVNPSRAFLSIDSGFPLADLEQAFRQERAFELPYKSTHLPVLFGKDYWMGIVRRKAEGDFVDNLLANPIMARLYVALGKIHRPTALALREKIGSERMLDFANVLDFFGGMFELKEGKAVVPLGPKARDVWHKLVGVSSDQGAEFLQRLVELDDGWMVSYYDSMWRVDGRVADYFSDPARLERFYMAVRGKVTSPGPARPIFRANSDLMLLITRLDVKPNGQIHLPGGMGPWKNLFTVHPHGEYDGRLAKAAPNWTHPDDVVEAMFGMCRKMVENEPLQMFISLTNMDRARDQPMSPAAVEKLLLAYPDFGDQFSMFNEAPALSEETILAYFDSLPKFKKGRNLTRRADAIGTHQALFGLWRIFVRQGQIPSADADRSFRALMAVLRDVGSEQAIFEAGRAGVKVLLAATGSSEDESPQDRLIELLAGNPNPNERGIHEEMVQTLNSRFTSQRLVSVKDIFDLADHLERVSRGESFNVAMANRLASRISEVRLPRSSLSSEESNTFAQGTWIEKHIQRQRSMNLSRAVDKARGQPESLLNIRGNFASILRDSLVGLNYIYYSPPGAELIRANPLFVRSHDFFGSQQSRSWAQPRLSGTGWPNSAGGRMVGSLNGLAFALADAEQNFLVPTERQALIWQDLEPQIMIGAVIPRWWRVTQEEQHFVALHLRLANLLVAASALDEELAARIDPILRKRLGPHRLHLLRRLAADGKVREGIDGLTPAERYRLATVFGENYGNDALDVGGPVWRKIAALRESDRERFAYQRIAGIFGTPHPALSHTYRSDLLHLPLFPTMMKFSSRIMAESWESTNLYWATLADELHIEPVRLNLLIPEWTQRSIERIFATNLDDWPALLHSMQVVAERYRQQMKPRKAEPLRAGQE